MRRVAALEEVRAGTVGPVPQERKRLRIDETTLAYVDAGDPQAEPIVLLHGYMGSHLSWRHHIQPLSISHRVLALDWFGWGDSGRSLDLRYDYDTEVDRLRRVLDGLGIQACNLFGHDYGGFLALGLCERHPQRVLRLAVLASRAHQTFTRKWAAIFGLTSLGGRVPLIRSLIASLPHTAIHRRGVERELRRAVFDDACFAHYAGWMSKDPDGGRFLAHFFSQYRVQPRAELARGLSTIGCPTAVVYGRNDPYVSVAVGTDLAARIPTAELTVLEDTGHYVMEERPREVQRSLADLLARGTS
jgi:pimeloyl-ACP methyl ester carboxylesterase